MSIIKQKGMPTRNTKGSIGDIYHDLNTGNRYKCTFAYVSAGTVECDWKLIGKDAGKKEVAENPVIEEVKAPVIEEPVVEEVVTEEVVEEPAVEEVKDAPKPKTNYAKQYQNKK